MTDLAKLELKRGFDRRLRAGSPWIFANEVVMSEEIRTLPPGSLARLALPGGRYYGLVHVNPHALIVARLLTRNVDARIDVRFFAQRFERALRLRERFLPGGYYRLIHGEGDGLPGLVVDRFGEVVVVQPNTAGMDAALETVLEGVRDAVAPAGIVVRADSHARAREGLETVPPRLEGEFDTPLVVREADLAFLADPIAGQKTGWFFDQRPNRATVRGLGRGARVLDLYSYAGGFALAALAGGAAHVHAVERSAAALALAERAAATAGAGDRLLAETGDALDVVGRLTDERARFDLVVADPPPFARAKKDAGPAARAYRKLARAAAGVTAPEGLFAVASCSHHVDEAALVAASFQGLRDAGRSGRLVVSGGAGPDHPLHPALPETRYLSFLLYALD
jgi:23S rRNA (cytosine1962-C5)-methyltransferase